MRLILRKHTNILMELIRSANFDPLDFSLSEEATEIEELFRLDFRDLPHYFVLKAQFQYSKRQFFFKYTTFNIAYPNPEISEGSSTRWDDFEGSGTWRLSVPTAFDAWLSSIKRHLEYLKEEEEDQMIPDLWSGLRLSTNSSSSLLTLPNTPFSEEEQIKIDESLYEYLEEIKRRAILTTEQLKILQEEVEDLVKSSKRLGRKDWLRATIGALIGFTLTTGLKSSAAIEVIRLAGDALQWLAHTPLRLPHYTSF